MRGERRKNPSEMKNNDVANEERQQKKRKEEVCAQMMVFFCIAGKIDDAINTQIKITIVAATMQFRGGDARRDRILYFTQR